MAAVPEPIGTAEKTLLGAWPRVGDGELAVPFHSVAVRGRRWGDPLP